MKSFLFPVLFLILGLLFSIEDIDAQIYVDRDATGANNGTSWVNAYTDLQSALAVAVSGNQIWVAEGTYRPTTCSPCLNADRLITFDLPSGVQIYGGFDGSESSLSQQDFLSNPTILSGDIGVTSDSTDNTFRILTATNPDSNTRLDGLIIEEGNCDGSSLTGTPFNGGGLYVDASGGIGDIKVFNTTIRNNFAGGGGGVSLYAILGGSTQAEFNNCVFDGNSASLGNVSSTGAGIQVLGNSGAQVSPSFIDCIFQNNYTGNDGGAIAMTPSGSGTLLAPLIERCTFINNSAVDRGAGIWYRMVSSGNMKAVIKDCVFEDNVSGGQGGAVFGRVSFSTVAEDTIVNCIFRNNRSTGTSSINDGEGGALFLRGSQSATRTTEVLNCVFDSNYASDRGGALATTSVFSSGGINTTNVINCTFFGNSTDGDGGGIHAEGNMGTNTMNFKNTILWADSAQGVLSEFFNNLSTINASYSNIDGGVPAGVNDLGNNSSFDPQFIDPNNGDLHIPGSSDLVDIGDNGAVLPIMDPDPDGDQRIRNGTVDLGAYEIGVIYVDEFATGANNGTSWTDAFNEFQDGINTARGGDQVWVANGTYYPTSCGSCTSSDRLVSFILKSDTEVYGGFSGNETVLSQRDWTTNFSVLSGDIGTPIDSTDNTFRILIGVDLTEKTILDGMIVEEGNADGSSLTGTPFNGGGMYIDATAGFGNPKIRNCTFRNNFAGGGGAVGISCTQGGTTKVEFRDCIFDGNSASLGNVSSTGAGVQILGNSGALVQPSFIGCTFQNNYVGNDGGAISMTPTGAGTQLLATIDSCTFSNNRALDRGAGIWYRMVSFGEMNVVIKNSTFTDNVSGGQGAAIFARVSFNSIANDTLANCYFRNNISDGTSSVNDGEGGAVFIRGSQNSPRTHHILNCVFENNFAENKGGALGTTTVFSSGGTLNNIIQNCTFVGNSTNGDGGAIHNDASMGVHSQNIQNSIFWNNTDSSGINHISGIGDSPFVVRNDFEGGLPSGAVDGGANLDVDPKFLNESFGNFRLTPCSPLLDLGPADFGIVDLIDLDGDGDSTEIIDIDLDGNPRVVNGNLDLGAYEFNGSPSATEPMISTADMQTICPGGSISLSANFASVGEQGQWTITQGSGTISPGINQPNITLSNVSSGTVVLEWNITNPFCDFDPAVITIFAQDNVAPVASCTNATVILNAAGTGSLSAGDIDNGSTDNCGIATMVLSQSSFNCSDVGVQSVNLIVTDNSGNSSSCTAQVTVTDNIPPVLNCQTQSVSLDASGNYTLIPNTLVTSNSDACGISSLVADQTSFDCSNIGSNLITLTSTDNNGNSSVCQATLIILDSTDPVLTCQDNTIFLDASGNAILDPATLLVSAADACGTGAPSASQTNFSCSDLGPNSVSVFVDDPSGNTGSCISTVTVVDNLAPIAVCQDITVNLDMSGNASITPGQVDGGSIDNCGITSMTVTPNSFTSADIGANTVTLLLVDASGNSSSCTSTVTVENTNAPNAVCQPVTVQLDASGMASITASDIDGGSTAVAGIQGIAADLTTFDCSDLGTNSVTLTVTDNGGLTATCTAIVTVEDNIAPTMSCLPVTLQLDASGNATLTTTQVDNGSSDNCGISSLTLSQTAFSCTDLGLNSVTLNASDASGNTSFCTVNVTVEDNLVPTALCQDITVNLDMSGNASITPGQVDGGSTDNCGITMMSVTPNSFTSADLGANTVTLLLLDASGNSSSCTSTVTVENTNAPNAVCQPVTVQLDASGMASITASDIDGGSSAVAGIQGISADLTTFDCSNLGTNSVTLTVTDNGGLTATCTAIVTVEDNIAPTMSCLPVTLQLDASGNATLTTAQVDNGSSDNCGISSLTLSQTAFSCTDLGLNSVTLNASDASGNTSFCTVNVTVEDNLAPTALCQDITVNLDMSGNASITPGQVDGGSTDNCGIASMSVTPNSFTSADLGANTVTLLLVDASGNSSSCTSTVTVTNTNAPNAVCQPVTVQLDASGMASITASDIDGGSTAVAGIQGIAADLTTFDCSNLGTNMVTLTVTDNGGLTATCTAIVTVEDNIAPTMACTDVTLQLDGNGNATLNSGQVDTGSTDNCGISSLALSQSAFTCADTGVNSITLTASDASGNTSICVVIVTIEDDLSPTALCQDITVGLDMSGNASITPGQVDGGSTDNCGIASISVTPNSFDINDVGDNPVTLLIVDDSGNSSSCTAIVTVDNGNLPIPVCQNLSVSLDASGNASITAIDVDGGSTASAGIQSVTIDQNTFDCSNLGANMVTLTVVDNLGTSANCLATVNVVDIVPPAAVCQDLSMSLDSDGTLTVNASQFDNGSSDECGIASIEVSPQNFDCSNLGNNVLTLTVTDNSGNTSICNPTLTITDNTSPVVNCQPFTLELDEFGSGVLDPADVDNGSFDACGPVSLSLDIVNFDCGDIGTNLITLTATDVSGMASSCLAQVTVANNQAPELMCPADVNTNSCNTVVQIPVPIASFACGINSITNDYNFTGDASDIYPPGTTFVTWTVVADNGNTASCTMSVTVNNNLSVQINETPVLCNGDSNGALTASPFGGLAPYTFLWDDPGAQTTAIASGLSAGTYSVTITDGNGCAVIQNAMLSAPLALQTALTEDAISCFGVCDGVLTASPAGGTAPYSYLWDNGESTASISGLCAAAYDLTVTDNNGCISLSSFNLQEPDQIALNFTPVDAICGLSAGILSVTPDSGNEPYTYLWSNGGTDATITGLQAGTYEVTVNDNSGCETTGAQAITATGELQVNIQAQDISCNGLTDGSAEVLNANPLFFYFWSSSAIGPIASGLAAGDYTVTVIDPIAGCSTVETTNISEPLPIGSNVFSVDNLCAAGFGAAGVIPSGGSSPYQYLWSNGATTPSIDGLMSGTFSVTITDGNGCQTVDQVQVISENTGPIAEVFQVNVSCAGANDGIIDVTLVGGTAPFTFSWTDGPTTEDRDNLAPGIYTVIIMDANGCVAATSVFISEAGMLTLDLGSTPSFNNDGTAFVNVFGGVPPFTYQWSNGGTGPLIGNLPPGIYTVTVTDANGCTGTGSVEVDLSTATEDLKPLLGFELYPNPAWSEVWIDLELDRVREFSLEVFSIDGRRLFEQIYNEKILNTPIPVIEWAPGLYYLRFSSAEQAALKSFVVIKP